MAAAKTTKKPTGNANKKPAGTTGGGNGGEEEEEEEEEEEPKALTMEDVNKAISDRFSRFQKKLPKVIEGSLATVLAAAGITPKKPGEAEEEEEEEEEEEQPAGDGKAGKGKNPPAQQPAQQTQAPRKPDKKVAKLEKQIADMQAAQKAEADRVAREQEQNQLATVLPGLNVRPELVAPLTTYLRSEEGGRLVRRNAEGKVVFIATDEDGDAEEVGLKEGLTAWLKTPAGKAYVAPTNAQGSGATPAGKAPGVRTGTPTNNELDKELFGAFSGVGPTG